MKNDYIYLAIKEAEKAAKEGEIPVGAVIVKNNEIISIAHNLKEQLNCSTRHAEIIAIEEASKKLNDWRLNNCEMYVTMEPCIMCCGAMIQSRLKKVYYLISNLKFGGVGGVSHILNDEHLNHKVKFEKIENIALEHEMKDQLQKFFLDKR